VIVDLIHSGSYSTRSVAARRANYGENHWQAKEEPDSFPVIVGQRLLSKLCND